MTAGLSRFSVRLAAEPSSHQGCPALKVKPQFVITRPMKRRGENPLLSIPDPVAGDPTERVLAVIQAPIEWVKPSVYRVRKPGKRQAAHLEGSLTQFEFAAPFS